jgi:hypothetical protein
MNLPCLIAYFLGFILIAAFSHWLVGVGAGLLLIGYTLHTPKDHIDRNRIDALLRDLGVRE